MKQKQQIGHIVTTGCLADIGRIRTEQQDSLGYVSIPVEPKTSQLALRKGNLYVVADGVGGLEAGGVASRIAVATILESFYLDPATSIEISLKNAVAEANRRILAEHQARNIVKMQTTIVCAVVRGPELYLAHLGDSRAYLIRSGTIIKQTKDHSIAQERLDTDQVIIQDRNLITHFLGSRSLIEPEISRSEIYPGDILMLCSDGLHGEVEDETIVNLLSLNFHPQVACGALVEQAKLAGGKDNISLIVTRIEDNKKLNAHLELEDFHPPKLKEIENYSYTILAPGPQTLKPKRIWQRYQQLIVVAGSIMFVLAISLAMWLRQINNALQADLNRTQQILSELSQSIELLRIDYEQSEEYGPVNDRLLQRIKIIENQLQNMPDTVILEKTPTPFIILPATTPPPIDTPDHQ